ncbi:MAG: hypothetical protein A2Z14_15270 [Chloroflexi bacterium RBG_16_48_8]|nr:MAG: hypothetical protein A2Z14_15270 [Chloroflexi bacterium RBG_16_48_8]
MTQKPRIEYLLQALESNERRRGNITLSGDVNDDVHPDRVFVPPFNTQAHLGVHSTFVARQRVARDFGRVWKAFQVRAWVDPCW